MSTVTSLDKNWIFNLEATSCIYLVQTLIFDILLAFKAVKLYLFLSENADKILMQLETEKNYVFRHFFRFKMIHKAFFKITSD